MPDTLNQYWCMVSRMRDPKTNELTRKIILDEGLPELVHRTSSPALRNRIQKEISHGIQGNQHAG